MTLDNLWAGWRRQYVESADTGKTRDEAQCVFCRLAESGPPSADNGVLWRGEATFVVLNAYPYASGHVLILPLRHVDTFTHLTAEERSELWLATEASMAAISQAYESDGLNMGANLGRAAGAGIPGHLHLHVLPRWSGDTNFMTSVAGVRVMPESLDATWKRLYEVWPGSSG